MPHDPRVSNSLARLGGLYRDPSKVDRDASTLLKSSVGAHLTPGIAPLVENNGEIAHCLVLQGTIAMHFRGNTYQLLVDLYLPPGYPHRPPVVYVRLTENMYLKENHMHVGSDGKVYLPYLHEWNVRTHNLVELVVACSSVFSADPPVFTRAPTAAAPAAAAPQPPAPATPAPAVAVAPSPSSRGGAASIMSSIMSSMGAGASSSDPPPPMPSGLAFDPPPPMPQAPSGFGGNSSNNNNNDQAQAEDRLAHEAEEANQAREAARQADRDEQEQEQQLAAQQRWEAQKLVSVKEQVLKKVIAHLEATSLATKNLAQDFKRDQQRLTYAEEKLDQQLTLYRQAKGDLAENVTVVESKTVEIQEWLQEAKATKTNGNGDANQPPSVDDLVQPVTGVHKQMLDLSAENASLTDALYFVDRGLYVGHLDCNTHLKHVRRLAKLQFLARAHLMKINQQMLKRNPMAMSSVGPTASF